MSGTQMRASLLLTLEDQLTGGLNKLMEALDRLTATADKLEGALSNALNKPEKVVPPAVESIGRMERALSHLGETAGAVGHRLDEMWAKLEHSAGGQAIGHAAGKLGEFATQVGPIGGVAAGFGVLEPVKTFAEFENILRHIAITEGKSGDAILPEIRRLTTLFREDAQRTGQSSESIAKAYYDLVTTGIPASILDRVIGAHSQAATAYNISPEALGPAVGALLQNFKLPEADIGSALSALAQAAKEGRFKVEDFSRELPGVSGFMASLGMTGRAGADYGFAALETVMKNASNPGQAAADFSDALNYLTGNAAKRAFAQSGVDLPALLQQGEKAGKNPLDTILDKLAEMARGQDPVRMSETLHAVLHNQQAEQAIMALLQHRGEFNALRTKLDGVDQTVVQRDFNSAVADPITQTRLFNENLQQISRTLGEGFTPVLTTLNTVLGAAKDGLGYLNEHFPLLIHVMLGLGGAGLGLVSVLGVVGFAMPAVTAGFGALGAVLAIFPAVELGTIGAGLTAVAAAAAPVSAGIAALTVPMLAAAAPIVAVTAAVAALAGVAYEVWQHWDAIKNGPAPTLNAEGHRMYSGGKGLGAHTAAPPSQVHMQIGLAPGLVLQRVGGDTGTVQVNGGADANRAVGRD